MVASRASQGQKLTKQVKNAQRRISVHDYPLPSGQATCDPSSSLGPRDMRNMCQPAIGSAFDTPRELGNFNENHLTVCPVLGIILLKGFCTLPLYDKHLGGPSHDWSQSCLLFLKELFFTHSFLLCSFPYYFNCEVTNLGAAAAG